MVVNKLLWGALMPPSESAGVKVHINTAHKWATEWHSHTAAQRWSVSLQCLIQSEACSECSSLTCFLKSLHLAFNSLYFFHFPCINTIYVCPTALCTWLLATIKQSSRWRLLTFWISFFHHRAKYITNEVIYTYTLSWAEIWTLYETRSKMIV